ncbi:phosphotransferase enzyme family protein [Porcipelethomonas sp.]|uniref:phosphotransferase enzyme family protein n=1 Tax=Porcipelethomonas sp. TaxID=2981675 RepID=UPI003EF6E61E
MNILTLFGLKNNYTNIIRLNSGHINLTLRIIYSSGQSYILQKINKNVFHNPGQVMANTEKICRIIPDCKIHYLYSNEKNYLQYNNEFWRIYEFVDNSVSYETADSAERIYEFGRILGEFHRSTEKSDPSLFYETIKDFHNTRLRINNLLKYETESMKKEFLFFRKILEYEQCLQDKNIPVMVAHNDVKCSNALFDEATGKCITLIDFDTVMPGLHVYDFGDGARSVCVTENRIDLKKFSIYCHGYFQNIKNKNPEDYFLGMICITAELACRYLYDCLSGENYFAGKTYNQKMIRYQNLYELTRSLISDENRIKDIIKNYI